MSPSLSTAKLKKEVKLFVHKLQMKCRAFEISAFKKRGERCVIVEGSNFLEKERETPPTSIDFRVHALCI